MGGACGPVQSGQRLCPLTTRPAKRTYTRNTWVEAQGPPVSFPGPWPSRGQDLPYGAGCGCCSLPSRGKRAAAERSEAAQEMKARG